MKNRKIYAIRDRHTGFMNPIIDINHEAATRGFKRAITAPDSLLGFSPKDFSLYCLGEFDAETGMISVLPVPELVVDAFSLVEE